MAIQRARKLFSIKEYEKMIANGVLAEDDRLELIEGEIVEMAPIGLEHSFAVSHLIMLFAAQEQVRKSALIWSQGPLHFGTNTRPEPDITLLRPRPDLSPKSPPTAADVILIIEVADSSISYDRITKARLYAGEGIEEYWIVNIKREVIEVYTQPSNGKYAQVRRAKRGDTLQLPGGLQGAIAVDDVLG